MSPKGGIRPHKRFSVESKRSEVLFVDYMAEHLNAGGRAGIIVPEGIIFQSQNAHKQLRKKLVEECLVAVVSLPAGVFNPYSGVKTSILLLDKALARKTDRIAFFKVENDGYDLGAQRRAIDLNDLPQVRAEISAHMQRLREGEAGRDIQSAPVTMAAESRAEYVTGGSRTTDGLIVEKEKVAADGEYNLGGERYRVKRFERNSSWPFVSLGEIAEYINGFSFKPTDWKPKGTKIIRIQNLTGSSSKFNFSVRTDVPSKYMVQRGDLLISWSATIGFYIWNDEDSYLNQHIFKVVPKPTILKKYLYYCKDNIISEITENVHGNTMRHITKGRFESIQIPLPPLEVQKEIVAEIEGYQKVIDGARAVVENYRPHIHVDPGWPMVELGGLCERIQYGLSSRLNSERTGYKTFRMHELVEGKCVDYGSMKFADVSADVFEKYQLRRGDVLFNRTNSIEHVGRTGIFDLDGLYCFASYLIRLSVSENSANPFYVNAFMNTADFQAGIKKYASRAIGQSNINAKSLAAYLIPLPQLETQHAIVSEIQAEQSLVDANRALIERFEKKVRDAIARVWEN